MNVREELFGLWGGEGPWAVGLGRKGHRMYPRL